MNTPLALLSVTTSLLAANNACPGQPPPSRAYPLKVSENHRYLRASPSS